jgi:hypothetical protein
MATNKKPSPQMIFFKDLLVKYRQVENSMIHPRGFHYYIVTRPESERQIPSSGGPRLYENTWNEYKNLCSVVANARVLGLIPFDWISDNRNEDIDLKLPIEHVSNTFEIAIPDFGETPVLGCKHMDSFKDVVNSILIRNNTKPCHFNHQSYHICVVIEKSSFSDSIQLITKKHGADFIVFAGQASVTRVNEVCLRAKSLNLPLLALYCSDLDVAGYFMPTNFMRRVNQIYPNNKNRLERVLLTRGQTAQHNLPPSFEVKTKKYPKKQVDEFVAETGSDICVELDALPKRVLLELIEKKLTEFSHLDEDKKEFDKKSEQFSEMADAMNNELDISEWQEDYDAVKEDFDVVIERVQDFQSEIVSELDTVESRARHIKNQIESNIDDFISNYEKEHPIDDSDDDTTKDSQLTTQDVSKPIESTSVPNKDSSQSTETSLKELLDLEPDENELDDENEEETDSD